MKFIKTFSVIVITVILLTVVSVFPSSAVNCKLKATIKAANVNIRSGAGINYKILKRVSKKTTVTLLNTNLYNKEWYKIKLSNGKKGYVHEDYLKIKRNQIFIPKTKTAYVGYNAKYSVINTTGSKVNWSSSDKSIAKVSSMGNITALKAGTVTITATAGTAVAKSVLKVTPATVTLGETPDTLFLDDEFTLKATCKKAVTFKSSDVDVATIDSKGVIKPLKAGKVTFTAKSNSDVKSCTIEFKKRVITLTTPKTKLYVGCHTTISASGGKYDYTYTSSNTDVLTVTDDGFITAVGEGTAKITCTSGDISKSKKYTIEKGKSVNISNTQSEVNVGMTLYLKSSTSDVTWSSNNTDVATVENGYVLGHKKGTAIITVSTSKGASDCIVTVKSAHPVRFVYTSENSASIGDKVTFYSITDTKRKDVKFKITDPDGKSVWLTDTTKISEDGRYIWSKSEDLNTAGVYKVEAYSKTSKNAEWKTSASGQCTTFVSKSSGKKATAFGERRASSDAINMIAQFEGFVPTVYTDKLANVPTVGYGRVVYAGSTFYNGMTQKEAFAFLVKTVNDSGYTSRVNNLLTSNNIKFNQQQFDALVDFSYNLGAYAITNNDELLETLLDSYGKESNKTKGFVNSLNVEFKSEPKSSASTIKILSPGANVTLVDTKVYNSKWYKLVLSDDTQGYVLKSKITKRTTKETVRNLNNVSVSKFAENYLAYHHSLGECYKGLVYRRMDEVEMFFYSDYIRDGKDNKYSLSYKCSKNSDFKI